MEASSVYVSLITAPGYLPVRELNVGTGRGKERVEEIVRMGRGGTVVGRTVERGTGRALSGVRVLVRGERERDRYSPGGPEATSVTDAEGRFRFEGVDSGAIRVEIRPEASYAQVDRRATVDHARTRDLGEIELTPGGATVRGRVVQGSGEEGVADVEISLAPDQRTPGEIRTARTGRGGAYEFSGLPAGKYTASLVSPLRRSAVELQEGETEELDFRLGSGQVRGVVLFRGRPVPVASVGLVHRQSAAGVFGVTDTSGRFLLENLESGRWKARLEGQVDGAHRVMELDLHLSEGETVDREFVLGGRVVRGKVTDREGNPVDGAAVRLVSSASQAGTGDGEYLSSSNSRGEWVFYTVGPGTYTAAASSRRDGFSDPQSIEVAGAQDPSETVLVLKGKERTGRLVSVALSFPEGKPVREAVVRL